MHDGRGSGGRHLDRLLGRLWLPVPVAKKVGKRESPPAELEHRFELASHSRLAEGQTQAEVDQEVHERQAQGHPVLDFDLPRALDAGALHAGLHLVVKPSDYTRVREQVEHFRQCRRVGEEE